MTTEGPPRGCGNISSDYYLLCDTVKDWGIVLESLATAGVLTTIILILALFCLICKVQDNCKRSLIPVQFFFLLGTLGIFGLTFAFIIKLNERTAPTRFFLWGVLFALCFSCLLVHAFNLIKLVRGRTPSSTPMSLVITFSLTIVQIIIAIQYVIINIETLKQKNEMDQQSRDDFVLLLIYVLFLMALLFVVCLFVFCGPYRRWKRHGAHIFITSLFSIGIWVAWITLLMKPNRNSSWDDPVMSVALVANGWVFLILYAVPEFCFLTAPEKPGDYPPENNFCQPKHMKKTYGVENRAYAQEDNTAAPEEIGDHPYIPYSTHFQLETLESQQDFSIPRPKTRPSPYQGYAGGKGVK
ncbi:retinoic acid-induced protein 3-like [Eublepharis macularius]|uniref:Retinoic acid-induced protein 3-like n=1 Tax=Eublepharis macularius TaxID=481883 RepID=A0AA97L740_EUBMA|nr:retinoic acid-induced protein 3-like [Eublepharis macularius]XP_054844669.1 retinoic acid-induced protein 3-like [Eublepharis macularius]